MFRAKCIQISEHCSNNFGAPERTATFRIFYNSLYNGSTFSFVISLGDSTFKIGETYSFTAQPQMALQEPLGTTAGDDGGEAHAAVKSRAQGSV